MAISSDEALSAELANDVAVSPPGSPPRRWFYIQAGERYGPVTGPELRAAALLGFVGPRDRVGCGSDGPWAKAGNVHGLFNELRAG